MINRTTRFNPNWGRQTVSDRMQVLAEKAMLKSIDVRKQAGLALNCPICIYSLCDRLKVKVRFVDISMEGMYVHSEEPAILLSALRPLTRRNFTCAHELGHHVFGHGSTVDELIEDSEKSQLFNPEEFLVDSFAGFLLMPIVAVRKAFVSRGWDIKSPTPVQIFTIACTFGVGYTTLINHMAYALKAISRSHATLLLKSTPKAIRQEILGFSSTDPLIVADEHWSLHTLDAEVGSQLLLPNAVKATNDTITFEKKHPQGCLFRANRPGIVRVACPTNQWAVFVRVSRYQFVGLSQYRHLEEVEDE